MPVQKSDEETVVFCAIDLFRRHGYHKTTMAELGTASGLLKGSLYHYFPGKEQLAIRAMETVHGHFRTHVFPLVSDPTIMPADRLKNFADAVLQYFDSRDGGCLIGNLALETIDSVGEFRPAIQSYFSDWVNSYATVYQALGLTRRQALTKAREAVALIQGALMMNRIFGNKETLREALTHLARWPMMSG
ncbi:MAG: TetR/AcrR family transcriptional regulator [Acidiferrobacteraceae bacterium]